MIWTFLSQPYIHHLYIVFIHGLSEPHGIMIKRGGNSSDFYHRRCSNMTIRFGLFWAILAVFSFFGLFKSFWPILTVERDPGSPTHRRLPRIWWFEIRISVMFGRGLGRGDNGIARAIRNALCLGRPFFFFYWPSGSGKPLAPTCSYTAYTLSVNGLAYFLCYTGSWLFAADFLLTH